LKRRKAKLTTSLVYVLPFETKCGLNCPLQVSDEMKNLNRRFGWLHGISSLANLGAVIALGFHGLWIGKAGVKGY
jgi:hypothetical protein